MIFLTFFVILALSKAENNITQYGNQLWDDCLKNFFNSGLIARYTADITGKNQFGYLNSGKSSEINFCGLCNEFMKCALYANRHVPLSNLLITTVLEQTCERSQIEDKSVCQGVLKPYLDIIFFIVHEKKDITEGKICSLLLGPYCKNQFEFFDWSVQIPVKQEKENFRIVQISDLHYDPRYLVGGNAKCTEPMCCQDDQGTPQDPKDACGYWGTYVDADTPKHTLMEMLRHIKTQNFDYVYFTGDIISHRVWSTSKSDNSKEEMEIMNLFRSYFNNSVVYFVLGNHEPHPLNSYAPLNLTKKHKDLSTNWTFDNLKEQLMDEKLKDLEFHAGGFYTTIVKDGFRLIVLNNNVCYTYNLWLLYDDEDVYGQLKWLVTVLEKAEKNKENVHLLYHIPSGDEECLGTWGREFTKIIKRYSHIIKAQFNGHTHWDEFFLYYKDSSLNEAVNVAYNGASVTTYTNNNPSYKIYEIDSTSFEVVDFEEWTFNLTEANLKPNQTTVNWYKLYSFKDTYNVTSMEPKILGKMVKDMATNLSLLQTYNKYRYRMGDGADQICDDECNKNNLCRIVTSSLHDTEHCKAIKKIYDKDSANIIQSSLILSVFLIILSRVSL